MTKGRFQHDFADLVRAFAKDLANHSRENFVAKDAPVQYEGSRQVDKEAMRKSSVVAMTDNVTGEIRNPLAGIPKEQLLADVDDFARKYISIDDWQPESLELLGNCRFSGRDAPSETDN